jgi:hypothetical protein
MFLLSNSRVLKSNGMRWVRHIALVTDELKRQDQMEELSVLDGTKILKCILRSYVLVYVNWVHLAQDMSHLLAFFNTAMNRQFP